MAVLRKVLAGSVALVTAPIGSTFLTTTAGAVRSCTPFSDSKFDGKYNFNVGNMAGIASNITIQYGAFCSSAVGGFDTWSAWAMLTGGPANRSDYAQSGVVARRCCGANDSVPYDFAQVNRGDGSHAETVFTNSYRYPGNTVKYLSQVGAYTTLEMYSGTTLLLRSSFPAFGNWPGPNGYQLSGESNNLASDMPGIPSATNVFGGLQWKNGNDWSYAIPAGVAVNDNTNHWTMSPGGGGFSNCLDSKKCFSIWTYSP